VNLTTRSKWLTGIAAAVAAWVFFGPNGSEPIEATHASARAPLKPGHTTSEAGTRAAQGALQSLAERVVDPAAPAALFAAHSWYVAPPPPPPVAEAPPAPPPPPTAPPLPYKFMGSYTPDGQKAVFFLSAGDKVYDVHVGDTLDNLYSIDSYNNGQLVLTYKPLHLQQQLLLTGAGQ
jgi:hypothetical protein